MQTWNRLMTIDLNPVASLAIEAHFNDSIILLEACKSNYSLEIATSFPSTPA